MTRTTMRLLAVRGIAVICLCVLAGCGSTTAGGDSTSASQGPTAEVNPAGDIPDDQVFVPYEWPAGGFSITVPEGWSRTESAGVVIFTDKLNSVRVQTADAAAAPTVESATANELPSLESSVTNYAAGDVSSVSRSAGDAVLITYTGDSEPDAVTGTAVTDSFERYEFWDNGMEVILTLSGPQGADNVDPWRIVTDSLQWLP